MNKIHVYLIATLWIVLCGAEINCKRARHTQKINFTQNSTSTNGMGIRPSPHASSKPIKPMHNHHQSVPSQQGLLYFTMHKLWAEHVLWTRQFVISSVAGLPDVPLVAQRLFKNQDDIGNAIVPFYGQEAGIQLAQLLRKHIAIYAEVAKAALTHQNQKVNNLYNQWDVNAAQIAQFLSSINPYWNQQALKSMLDEHLRLTGMELQLRIAGNFPDDVANFDNIFIQALMMGTELAAGIIKQFPRKF